MIQDLLKTQFVFVQGKGGVGKTSVSQALARHLSENYNTLWVAIEDPTLEPGTKNQISPTLTHLNNEGLHAFEEYAGLKIGAPSLVRVFLQNKLMQYLAKATPGLKELVLIGKIWHERLNFDRIVVDMPATGHGLTMFQSVFNWEKLFQGSILAKDAKAMIETFKNQSLTSHLIVSLPEEMPLVESLELKESLNRILPEPKIELIVNRVFPETTCSLESNVRPFAETFVEQASKRFALESLNLKTWEGLRFQKIPYYNPGSSDMRSQIEEHLNKIFESPEL
jgi:anion-transporting  ArsA/GET3 family ATPase